MEPHPWLSRALEELETLDSATQDPEDAWRALVLIARLLGCPSGPMPEKTWIRRLPNLLSACGLPDATALTDAVADSLETEDDPAGPLLDALLAVDDAVGVLAMVGDTSTAGELAERSAALVAVWPDRVLPLGGFASQRLETVRPNAHVARIWAAVERAPASLLADAMPATSSAEAPIARWMPDSVGRSRRQTRSFLLPSPALLAAAWTPATTASWEGECGGVHFWVYPEVDHLMMEIRLTEKVSGPLELQLVSRDGTVVARRRVEVQYTGSTIYLDLGTSAGSDSIIHSLLEEGGLPASDVEVRLVILDDDEG